jgi:hypothetical protein
LRRSALRWARVPRAAPPAEAPRRGLDLTSSEVAGRALRGIDLVEVRAMKQLNYD